MHYKLHGNSYSSVQDSSDESVAIAMTSIHVIHRLAYTNFMTSIDVIHV